MPLYLPLFKSESSINPGVQHWVMAFPIHPLLGYCIPLFVSLGMGVTGAQYTVNKHHYNSSDFILSLIAYVPVICHCTEVLLVFGLEGEICLLVNKKELQAAQNNLYLIK